MALEEHAGLRGALHNWTRAVPGPARVIVLAVIVGLGTGFGAVALRIMINDFSAFAFGPFGNWLARYVGDFRWLVIPALGGLFVGPMVEFWAKEAKGHGVPEVMEAVSLHGGRIRPHVALVKALASALCIGSGGSAGAEGPIAQIGAGMGSTVSQILGLSKELTCTLVACGGAGGIAATFNAPLAGAFFGLEIIVRDWSAESFGPVVVAAFCATVISRLYLGDHPMLVVPQYSVSVASELPMFAFLGIICAFVGVAFVLLLYWMEDRWDDLPVPDWFKTVPGGALVGVAGLASLFALGDLKAWNMGVFGTSYPAMHLVLSGAYSDWLLATALMVLKLFATCLTLSSGGSGGVFAPSLFMGCMVGAAFGELAHLGLPGLQTSPGAFALVGMAAVFAAASRAPVTSVLIVYEMTQDYRMILPLMLACSVSLVIGGGLSRFSIYNLKLVRRGIHVDLPFEPVLLSHITIADAMTAPVATVRPDQMLADIVEIADHTGHHGFPVVDAWGHLRGLVTMDDVTQAIAEGKDTATVAELAAHDLIVTYPDETLNEVLVKLGERHMGRLPVVERNDPSQLLGIVTRHDIVAAYNRTLEARHAGLHDGVRPQHFE